MAAPRISEKASALAEYWYRANLMRDLVHATLEILEDDQDQNVARDWEFRAYLAYWLSALFVVVEGFNRLKMKDAQVPIPKGL
jgi:hypothetical protein